MEISCSIEDMLKSKSWLADNAPKVLHEGARAMRPTLLLQHAILLCQGMLEISACRHAQNTKAEAAESVAIKRWVSQLVGTVYDIFLYQQRKVLESRCH